MTTKQKLLGGGAFWLLGAVFLMIVAPSAGKNNTFLPQNDFKLDPWLNLKLGGIDFSITKAVLYVVLATIATCWTMWAVARKMEQKPNKVQTAVELMYGMLKNNIIGANMDEEMTRRWFPFIGALFFFIIFSNLVGFIPLPTNTQDEVLIFGVHLPTFALYAATANISIPLVLAVVVFIAYTFEGVRAKGPFGYLKGLVPAGIHGIAAVPLFFLEAMSNVMRLVSLSVRLFANLLAGHLMILFFAGGLGVLLGVAAITWVTFPLALAVFLFDVCLVSGLQAFIFATLTAVYLGGAVAESH